MTPEQITLIQTSFKQVALQADAAATNFYHRLFTLQPALRLMFPADLTAQKQKLMTTLGFAVGSLTKFHALIPTLEALGRKHSLYGVRDEYYAVVGAALLSTLKELLGTKVFTPDTETAWAKMYGMVADVMKRAARQYSPETEYSQAEPVDQFAITQPLNDFPFAKPAIEPIEPLVQSYLQKLF